MAEALAFRGACKVKADIELRPLSSTKRVFDRLDMATLRVVFEFAEPKTKAPEHLEESN